MKHLLNNRVTRLQSSKMDTFFDMASQYEDVIHLTIGQPDFPTPAHIKLAGQMAIENNHTTHPPSSGYTELLKVTSNYMHVKYGLTYDPNHEILVTNGSTGGIYLALRTILSEGSEVILPTPIYPGYEPVIRLCGATPIYLDTRDTGFKVTVEALQKMMTDKTRCVIIPSPMNPSGVTLNQKEIKAIRDLLVDKDVMVVSDELYSELVFEEEHVSIAKVEGMKEKTIVINGLSKSHAMTGWRVGFAFAPRYLIKEMKKLQQYTTAAVSSISQIAAIEALTVGINDAYIMREQYRIRRDYVYDRLQDMGLNVIKPNGSFYFFPSISKFGKTSSEFVADVLKKAKVALIPGDSFTEYGEGYVRISYIQPMNVLEEALNRLEKYLGELQS
ncbi:aromatic amino acid aminotransferase [Bacillus wiedmannii]|uniref:aminotransferase A n=1 Tax=Bacillus wiedmannii TaxID=1890302 RepID=UPI000BFDECB7|nr:aminotransferase A [Bacillus wiedmannii]PHA26018.1 aromatic amino acid aminotransferase [Bacillus wiedmannii]PHB12127.1 aromatic amino acid aminotransferase [Bacillus wiedmannii]